MLRFTVIGSGFMVHSYESRIQNSEFKAHGWFKKHALSVVILAICGKKSLG
jgi:hypothetical protein